MNLKIRYGSDQLYKDVSFYDTPHPGFVAGKPHRQGSFFPLGRGAGGWVFLLHLTKELGKADSLPTFEPCRKFDFWQF